LATFGITRDEEDSLIGKEIQKFIWFIDQDKPPLFDSYRAFNNTNNDSYKDLYNIVDQIETNLAVIQHDNAGLAFKHYIRYEFNELFQKTRKTLRDRYQQEPKGIVGHKPETLIDEKRNMKAYHALVDYIFHSLAWWLMHVLERESWCEPMIAVLVRWTIKLKLVALEPVYWAKKSLAAGVNIMRKISEKCKDAEKISVDIKTPGKEGEPEKVDTLKNNDLDLYYYVSKTRIRDNLHDIIEVMLNNLKPRNRRMGDSTAFEVNTVLYRNDLYESLRQITIQQGGSVSTSSDTAQLGYSFQALQLLISNVESIPPEDTDSSDAATINWAWDIKRGNDDCLHRLHEKKITRLDDIVSMLVPIGLMANADNVKPLNRAWRWLSTEDEIDPAPLLGLNQTNNPTIKFFLTTRQGKFGRGPQTRSPLITSIKGGKPNKRYTAARDDSNLQIPSGYRRKTRNGIP
jgi:hypothetical protein